MKLESKKESKKENKVFKVVIVGAGVVGSAIARELSMYKNLEVSVLEAEDDVCCGTSKANNSHIVCGADVNANTIELEMVKRSNRRWEQLAKELDIEFVRCGSFNVALSDDEFNNVLPAIKKSAEESGVMSTRIIDRRELLEYEPNVSPEARGALYIPDDGSMLSYYLVLALAENAAQNGVKFYFEKRVTDIKYDLLAKHKYNIKCEDNFVIDADFVINSAGLYSDKISKLAGWNNFDIHPRKGEFWVLDKKYGNKVNSIVYGCPQPDYRGTTVVRTRDGNLMVGPTARDLVDKEDKSTSEWGLEKAWEAGKKIFPWLEKSMTIHQYVGLRARCATIKDYIIGWHPDGEQPFINAAGIRSTGISGSIGIGEYVTELLAQRISLEMNADFNPYRKGIKSFAKAESKEEKEKLIAENADYAKIVCRCQKVTEAEIKAALDNPLGVHSLDAIKRRTKAQMGRCQGGFCTSRIISIIEEKKGIDPLTITKRGSGSEVVVARTKEVL
ncbi:MAG: NAD(P)/FAD-dependent oxidoreductase [Oligoflexia bacterium]|nr:NAD(P)/FAD-dependent oxidoreductase [Oligoflexia bacterium]